MVYLPVRSFEEDERRCYLVCFRTESSGCRGWRTVHIPSFSTACAMPYVERDKGLLAIFEE